MESLKNDGVTYSDTKIYKVIVSKAQVEKSKATGEELIRYISVEASENEFKNEQVATIYLRDMTKYVKGEKKAMKLDGKMIKNQAQEKIIQTVAKVIEK